MRIVAAIVLFLFGLLAACVSPLAGEKTGAALRVTSLLLIGAAAGHLA